MKFFSDISKNVIIFIIAGFLIPIVLLFCDNLISGFYVPSIIYAVFLSIGVTGFTYNYLGGISEETSLKIGALKVSGSAAILLFLILQIPKVMPDSISATRSVLNTIPDSARWIPLDTRTLEPVDVAFSDFNETFKIERSLIETLNGSADSRNIVLKSNVYPSEGEAFAVFLGDSDIQLGILRSEELYRNNITDLYRLTNESFPPSGKLRPAGLSKEFEAEAEDSVPAVHDFHQNLDFYIEVTGFRDNYSFYDIKLKNGGTMEDADSLPIHDSILLRESKLYRINGIWYMLSVIEVNHKKDLVVDGKTVLPFVRFKLSKILLYRNGYTEPEE